MNSKDIGTHKRGDVLLVTLECRVNTVDRHGRYGCSLEMDIPSSTVCGGQRNVGWVNDDAIKRIERIRPALPPSYVWEKRDAVMHDSCGVEVVRVLASGGVCTKKSACVDGAKLAAAIDAVREASDG